MSYIKIKVMQKQVKIIGLSLNQQLGIVKATRLEFDPENRLIVFKGGVGEGKTTLQKSLQLTTQGQKALTDNNLYGTVDAEVQLLDGDIKIYIGAKSTESGKLVYTLYQKDSAGKKVKNPIIDGVKATPSKYLETLQTELTWRIDELTSENPNVQKKILLELYKNELQKIGVIFDKKHPDFEKTILGQIQQAEKVRDEKDMLRKMKGGILEDLKSQGFDPDKPDTLPQPVNISALEQKINELNQKIAVAQIEAEKEKEQKLAEIKEQAQKFVNLAYEYNKNEQTKFDILSQNYKDIVSQNERKKEYLSQLLEILQKLEISSEFENLKTKIVFEKEPEQPQKPKLISISNGQINETSAQGFENEAYDIIAQTIELRKEYQRIKEQIIEVDNSEIEKELAELQTKKEQANEINRICEAVDAFNDWREANNKVLKLKNDYYKLLAKVNTGVEGLQIVPENDNIFLMYNGAYDPKYFNNQDKELRKVSSYSGTQKPMIALLIQNYLLSKKPKALRYLFIDNIPIDKKTRALLEKMCNELDLTIFLNITGDFDKNSLENGEILIEGGEVFF